MPTSISSLTGTRRRISFNANGSIDQFGGTGIRVFTDATFIGYTNPKWKDQVRLHVGATTPASGHKIGFTHQTKADFTLAKRVSVNNEREQYIGLYTNNARYPSQLTAIPLLNADQLVSGALGRFYSKVYDYISPLKGGPILGELTQTIHSLKHPLNAIKQALRGYGQAVRRIPKGYTGKAGLRRRYMERALAGTWLEAKFGLIPLASDLDDALKLIVDRRVDLGIEYKKIIGVWYNRYGYISDVASEDRVDFSSLLNTYSGVQGSMRSAVNQKGRIIGEIRTSVIDGTSQPTLRQELGIGIQDFIPTLWEVMPWSWCFDYFTNMQEILLSFSIPKSRIAWMNATARTEEVRDYTSKVYIQSSNVYKTKGYSQSASVVAKAFQRSNPMQLPYLGLPAPHIMWDLPRVGQWANLTAVLRGLRRDESFLISRLKR